MGKTYYLKVFLEDCKESKIIKFVNYELNISSNESDKEASDEEAYYKE